jgi:hypothetical protein
MERSDGRHAHPSVVPGRKVLVEGGRAAVMIVPPHQPGACAPQIEVVRDGDVIRAIDVTCACGEKIRVRCVYDEADAGA